jgi:hypothetical protein
MYGAHVSLEQMLTCSSSWEVARTCSRGICPSSQVHFVPSSISTLSSPSSSPPPPSPYPGGVGEGEGDPFGERFCGACKKALVTGSLSVR